MWHKEYRDYSIDTPQIQEQVSSGQGIIGCEMHDINGWGTTIHIPKQKKKGLWQKFIHYLFRERNK